MSYSILFDKRWLINSRKPRKSINLYPSIRQLSVKKKNGAPSVSIKCFRNGIVPITIAKICSNDEKKNYAMIIVKRKQANPMGIEASSYLRIGIIFNAVQYMKMSNFISLR